MYLLLYIVYICTNVACDSYGVEHGTTTTTASTASTVGARRTALPRTQSARVPANSAVNPPNLLTSSVYKRPLDGLGDAPEYRRPVTTKQRVPTTETSQKLEDVIEDGIYWSSALEARLPGGFSADDDRSWARLLNTSRAVEVTEGCGRMQNRLVVLDDGRTRSCARYRQNNDQIQGDILSFLLGRYLLRLPNLVPSSLSTVGDHHHHHHHSSSSSSTTTRARSELLHQHTRGDGGPHSSSYMQPLWSKVRTQLHLAQWNVDKPVVLTKYVRGLKPAYIPAMLREDGRRLGGAPMGSSSTPPHPPLDSLNVTQLAELAQWSDLIVFDYLTANLDRVVNNLFNRQWNADMMNSPAHNLVRVADTGLLLFIDNESGLLHGYRLLAKYEVYHRSMLDSVCIFRRATADAVQELHRTGDVGERLRLAFYRLLDSSGLRHPLPFLPDRNVDILRTRLANVNAQIEWCRKQQSAHPTVIQ